MVNHTLTVRENRLVLDKLPIYTQKQITNYTLPENIKGASNVISHECLTSSDIFFLTCSECSLII